MILVILNPIVLNLIDSIGLVDKVVRRNQVERRSRLCQNMFFAFLHGDSTSRLCHGLVTIYVVTCVNVRHLSRCYVENSVGQWTIHVSFNSDINYKFVKVRSGNTKGNITRLSLEGCVYVEASTDRKSSKETTYWPIVLKRKPQRYPMHVSILWHNPITGQRKFQQAMIERSGWEHWWGDTCGC